MSKKPKPAARPAAKPAAAPAAKRTRQERSAPGPKATAKAAQGPKSTARSTAEATAAKDASAAKSTVPAARAADTPAGSAADTEAEGPRPGRLTAAAVLAALEGLALLVGGVYLLVRGLTGDPEDRSQAATGGVTLIVLALLPLIAARGLLRRRSWSRGPAIITQIMALPVAWTLLQADSATIPGGIALAVAAVAVLVLLVHADTTRALGIRGPGQAPEGEAGDGKRDGD